MTSSIVWALVGDSVVEFARTRGVMCFDMYVLLLLMYVLVSTGLTLQLTRLFYPSVISRGRWEGVLTRKSFRIGFVSIAYFKMI